MINMPFHLKIIKAKLGYSMYGIKAPYAFLNHFDIVINYFNANKDSYSLTFFDMNNEYCICFDYWKDIEKYDELSI